MLQLVACHLFGARPLLEQMLTYRDQTPQRPSYWNFVQRMYIYYAITCTSKCWSSKILYLGTFHVINVKNDFFQHSLGFYCTYSIKYNDGLFITMVVCIDPVSRASPYSSLLFVNHGVDFSHALFITSNSSPMFEKSNIYFTKGFIVMFYISALDLF